jgi:tetratricopeptide (TPR) repeat protein
MAKQSRRPSPPPGKSARSAPPPSAAAKPARVETAPPLPKPQPIPQRRTTYVEAVALYERGLELLQRHAYREAADAFDRVLKQYPDEKELHERARQYLNVCQRQTAPRESSPQTIDERLYAATLAINTGQYDQAIAHLRLVRDEDPDNDHALYMLAVAHAQRDEHAEAVAHLERAIALNGENRALARNDPDLEPLRDDDAFRAALETPAAAPTARPPDRRRPTKTRSAR